MHEPETFCEKSTNTLQKLVKTSSSTNLTEDESELIEKLSGIQNKLENLKRNGALQFDGHAKMTEEVEKMRVREGDVGRAKYPAAPNHIRSILNADDDTVGNGKKTQIYPAAGGMQNELLNTERFARCLINEVVSATSIE